jgi:hypothetical protein
MKTSLKVVTVVGLTLGGVLGIAGLVVPQENLANIFWALDAVGVIVATVLLAIHFFRKGCDAVAAGFLVFALGESVILSGTAATLEGVILAVAAGTALWAVGLLLTSVPAEFALWTRMAGVVTAVLLAIASAGTFMGKDLSPLSRPLPFVASPFLVLTFAGWAVAVIRAE